MVSIRKYLSILSMMLIILFLFQIFQVAKQKDRYEENAFAPEPAVFQKERQTLNGLPRFADAEKIILCGDLQSKIGNIVNQWCSFSKRNLFVSELAEVSELKDAELPVFLLIDCEKTNVGVNVSKLIKLAKRGVNIVFCNLPDPSAISTNPALEELLGISGVRQEKVMLKGVHLFEGFLLGGEVIYRQPENSEKNYQDLSLETAWYELGTGTKTYMAGMLDEKEYKSNEFPSLIWRHTYHNAMIFAVNGDYLAELSGHGILEAMMYETKDYLLYPVVNAHTMSVTACPLFANENSSVMQEYYSRNAGDLIRDIIWPGLVTISSRKKIAYTCFFGTKMNYEDAAQPSEERFQFYLQQMKEIGAEAGKSLDYSGTATPEEKWKSDTAFYKNIKSKYLFRAWYVDRLSQLPVKADDLGKGTATVVVRDTQELPLFGYLSNSSTYQGVTGEAQQYSFREDLKMRSLVTAYGYMNTLLPIEKSVWPEKESDRWEVLYNDMISNLFTFWLHYGFLQSTTASESDYRIRNYLNLDYKETINGSKLQLTVSGGERDTWFIMRTHGKQIRSAEDAQFIKIEENAFLIHATGAHVSFVLTDSDEILEYKEPFSKK